uniref:Neural proliferation, differentiation and control 1 n=1 Tax=Macaca fascicularis TaxID=9541 RepID=A0A2K5W8W8_MACFA
MATPLPPPSPRHLRLLRLLLSGLVLGAALRGAAAGHPDAAACPGSLDCALKRRSRCPPGAHACGPCLQPFQEDQQGLCVPRMRRPPGGGRPQPRLEDEIDFLAQELARKESGHSTPPLPKARQRLPEPATLGFSARGQGLELGLPSTPGTPMPTPHTSLGSPVSSEPVHMSPLRPGRPRPRLQREIRLTQKTDYTAAKSPGSPAAPRISPGDQRLAHSAEMYHYQHQRQQMLCLERHKEPPKELDTASSDEENEDGDFTVYECPGLAPTGEMEVRNPLFDHAALSAPLPAPRLTACAAMTWRQTDAHLLPDLETPGEGQGPELPTKNMF